MQRRSEKLIQIDSLTRQLYTELDSWQMKVDKAVSSDEGFRDQMEEWTRQLDMEGLQTGCSSQ